MNNLKKIIPKKAKYEKIMVNNLLVLICILVGLAFCFQHFIATDANAVETFTTKSPKKTVKAAENAMVDKTTLHIDVPKISSEIVSLPLLDVKNIITEDKRYQKKNKKLRVSVHMDIERFSDQIWRVFPRPDGRYSWRVVIYSPNANFIRPHFKEFPLADTKVYLYDEGAVSTLKGPIKKPTANKEPEFWGPIIKGEYLYVEIIQESATAIPTLYIDKISHGYRDLEQLGQKAFKEDSCYEDVNCYSSWDATKTGVARMYFEENGSGYKCTGSLVMDVSSSFRNWFLTANHCISDNTVAKTLQAYFNFRTDTCGGTAPYMWGLPYVSGATFKVGKSDTFGSDFSLLELDEDPPSGVYYLGWTTDDLSYGGSVTSIHHPDGTYQRISFGKENDSLWTLGDFWDVKWYSGSTEGGSSGAPLFNSDKIIVGQLYGCADSLLDCAGCSSMSGHDSFGKFSVSYNDGLSNYLGSTLPPADPAILISPSGTIATTNPTYTWNAVSNATGYRLWVNNSGTSYTADAAGCSSGSGTCSITGSTLSAGRYTWYVRGLNINGNGPWSSGMDFTISDLPPSCPDLYSWNGSEYLNNGSLYKGSHCPERENYQERLVTQPVVEQNNTLTFKIKEVDDEISHINSVAMYYRKSGNVWTELELISAVHSRGPDLKEYLTKKDNNRVYTAPGDEILLTYRVPPGGVENAEFVSVSSGYYLWSAETWCQVLDLGPTLTVQPGETATLQARINNMSAHYLPADARIYFNIQGPAGYSSVNIFPFPAEFFPPGNPQWYSINWVVPNDAPAGEYTYSASVYSGEKNITWDVNLPIVSENKNEVVNVDDIVKKRPDHARGYSGPR